MLKETKVPRPKDTSFEYGMDYQLNQANKYRDRNNNHWKQRIDLANNLVEKYALTLHQKTPKNKIVVVDVGCSIGTFAIEFAKLGYDTYGIDFDKTAIDVAKVLSTEENVTPQFVCGDISEWTENLPPVDIAVCFDIFEHMHDDELGSFLSNIRKQFKENGVIVFHTFPTQYNYIFYERPYVRYPLLPFRNISQTKFTKILKFYSCLLDLIYLIKFGQIRKEHIKYSCHLNPTTEDRLTDIFNRAGFEIIFMESSNIYNFKAHIQKQFHKQPSTYRNLYGVAKLK